MKHKSKEVQKKNKNKIVTNAKRKRIVGFERSLRMQWDIDRPISLSPPFSFGSFYFGFFFFIETILLIVFWVQFSQQGDAFRCDRAGFHFYEHALARKKKMCDSHQCQYVNISVFRLYLVAGWIDGKSLFKPLHRQVNMLVPFNWNLKRTKIS